MATIEDFEDQSLSEYGGDTGSYSITTSGAHDGTYGLEVSSAALRAISTTNYSLSDGNKYQWWANFSTANGNSHQQTLFFTQDETNNPHCYLCRFRHGINQPGDSRIELLVQDGGGTTSLASQSQISVGTGWYQFEFVAKTDGTREFALLSNDDGVEIRISATDTTWNSGGLGFNIDNGGGSSDTMYWDTIEDASLGGSVVDGIETVSSSGLKTEASSALSSQFPASGSFTVETNSATSVGSSAATLNGELTDLGTESSVDVFFRWSEFAEDQWFETAKTTLTSTGTFSESISGLTSSTTHDFYAVAETPDLEGAGEVLQFTTT